MLGKILSFRYLLSAALLLPTLLVSTLLASTLSLEQEENWQTIGTTHVRSTAQMVTIPILKSFQSSNIKSIRFHASKGDIEIRYAKLILNDGDNINVSIQRTVRSGLNSRIIPVEIHDRVIKKVILFYEVQRTDVVRIDLQAQISSED
ncbi:hypothetical protein [Endozoicomonas lisbonensis]|uniref:DUF2541 domain-containing protein n=1 Tax=Endozoicomonas lisbonensis TaxID=3120522 RepID=A0ABV2SGN6_9GAMM